MARDSVVGIGTGWKVRGSNSGGSRSSAPVHNVPGAHPASCTMGTMSFPGLKQAGSGIDYSPPSSTEVQERVELYLYSLLGLRGLLLGEVHLLRFDGSSAVFAHTPIAILVGCRWLMLSHFKTISTGRW